MTKSKVVGKKADPVGVSPAVVLWNPKHADNVGKVVRLASCFGVSQVWWTGDRVQLDLDGRTRLPREERMKGYKDVQQIQFDYPFDQFKDATPVAVEVRKDSEPLYEFQHPENAVYVFGPEDGSIPSVALRHCHRFVVIPTRHCLNLATAASIVLWDRAYKEWLNSDDCGEIITPCIWEERGFVLKPALSG